MPLPLFQGEKAIPTCKQSLRECVLLLEKCFYILHQTAPPYVHLPFSGGGLFLRQTILPNYW